MASTGTAVTLTLGAALGAGWASTMGKAKGDISGLGGIVEKTRAQQQGLGLPDFGEHEKNTTALADAKLALDKYRDTLDSTRAAKHFEESEKALLAFEEKMAGVTFRTKEQTDAQARLMIQYESSRRAMESAAAPTEEQAAILARLTKQHDQAEKTYRRSEKAIKDRTIALKAEGKDVAALTAEHKRLGEVLQRQLAFSNAWKDTKTRAIDLGKTVLAGAGIISAATTASYKFVNATAAEGEAINQASSRLGMSVSALQEFRFAAEQSSMGAEKFEGGLDKLSQGLDDALIKKSGPAHDALTRMGLDMRVLATMPADERLAAISDALASIADTDTRASLSSDLFGKDAGRGFNTMLSGGRKAIEQMRQQARESGAVWDTGGAEEYQSSLGALRTSWASLGRVIGTTLMPAFTKLNTTLRNVIIGNGGAVGKSIGALANALSGLAPLVGGIARVAGFLFGLIGKAPWLVNTLVFALGVLGYTMLALKFGTMITSVISLGRTFLGVIPLITGFNVALTANPIGVVVVAIGLLVAGIYALWKNWSAINTWFDDHPIFDGILRVIFPLFGVFRLLRRHWEPIKAFSVAITSAVASAWSWLWDGLKTNISIAWDFLKAIFSWSPLGLVIRAYGAMFKWLEEKFGIFTKIGGAIKTLFRMSGFGRAEEEVARDPARPAGSGSIPPSGTIPRLPDVTPIMRQTGDKTVHSSVSVSVQQQPGEDQDSLVRRVVAAIDQQQSALLDGALADPA